jgi:hypothetical protein
MSCEACTKEKARFAALSVDFENLQAELVAKRREIGRLRGELTKQHQSSPEHQSVQSVFDHWRAECGHDKAKLGEKRAAVVRARLRDNFTEDQLLRAVDGVAMFPFVVNGQRRAKGKPDQRYDDLELICRNEVNVEKFIGLIDAVERDKRERRERAKEEVGKVYGTDTLTGEVRWHGTAVFPDGSRYPGGVELLFERLGRDCVVRGASPKWTVQCPAHDDRDPSLSVREAPDGSVLLHCFAGCKTFDVLQALGLGWADIGSPHAIGRVS